MFLDLRYTQAKTGLVILLCAFAVACGGNNEQNNNQPDSWGIDEEMTGEDMSGQDMPDMTEDVQPDMPAQKGCPADLSLEPDRDRDGLKDCEEEALGTDPTKADTDGDGLDDYDEIDKHKTDPKKADTDGDGLSDSQEINTTQTNANEADTDGDGLNDGVEVNRFGTKPNNPDTDGDGLDDRREVQDLMTDPLKVDTDGDGLNDDLEVAAGSDPLKEDTDGDGLSDLDEVQTHMTDPTKTDTDGDGLSDPDELQTHRTDPTKADTDGDGLNDGDELNQHMTSPTDSDTDFDGLSDGEEINQYMTDPFVQDTDGDGLLDVFEVQTHMTDPLKVDTDGDGLTDKEEVDLGSDPLKADTDGDSLSDGQEVQLGLDPTKSDSYGDGTQDDMRWFVTACLNGAPPATTTTTNMTGDWAWTLPQQWTVTQHTITTGGAMMPATHTLAYTEVPLTSPELVAGVLFEQPALTQGLGTVMTRLGTLNPLVIKNPGPYTTYDGFDATTITVELNAQARRTHTVRDLILHKLTDSPTLSVTPTLSTTTDALSTSFTAKVTVISRPTGAVYLVAVSKTSDYYGTEGTIGTLAQLTSAANVAQAGAAMPTSQCRAFAPVDTTPDMYLYWIADQSGSMNDDFATIRNQLPTLFGVFGDLMVNVKLGVTNMSANFEGRLRAMIGWHTSLMTFGDEIQYYAVNCQNNFPMCSGFAEHGLYNAYKGLEFMKSMNAPPMEAVPPDAPVGVVFVTDENDQSIKDQKDPNGMTNPNLLDDYVTRMTTLKAKVFAIATTTASGCGFEVADGHLRLAAETDGGIAELCTSAAWKPRMDTYLRELAAQTNVTYQLQDTPLPSTIRVIVNGQDVPRSRVNGFDYFPSTNSIAFFGTGRPALKTANAPGDAVVVIFQKR